MRYEAYRQQTERAAAAISGAAVVSLAGGYYGVAIPLDGARAVLALDLDGILPEWLTWSEDADGERCCDDNAVPLGLVRPSELATLADSAARAILAHNCRH